jgi:predicted TIM-barrel fold metal-dependent hydrolase
MEILEFSLDPTRLGLPSQQQLRELRIWDGHYHGFNITENENKHRAMSLFAQRMGIERLISLDIGGARENPFADTPFARRKLEILAAEKDRLSGMCRINPADPEGSCRQMEKLIRNGPCIGIKYGGPVHNPEGILCSHPNNDPIIRLAQELGAVVYIHTWMKVGGALRVPGLGNDVAEPTPKDVVILAKRFPNHTFICGHSGGDWELGVREVRPQKNVLLEFAGSDPHSGQVEYAVAELGIDRIVWGGHGPSRSYSTELGKVFDSGLSPRDQKKILGENYRRLAAPIFQRKGWKIEI